MPQITSALAINSVSNSGLGVEPKWNAARVSTYPNEGDWFHLALETGNLTAVAAGGHLFSMRNLHATRIIYLSRIAIRYYVFTAFTTAQELGLTLSRISGAGTTDTGGTNITAIPRMGLSSQGASVFANAAQGLLNIATAGALTAGTATIDANPMFTKSNLLNTVGALIIDEIIEFNENNDSGVILGNNEGIILQNKILLGATGLMRAQIRTRWREL